MLKQIACVALALAACKGKVNTSSGGGDCEVAVGTMMKVQLAEMPKDVPPEVTKELTATIGKVKDAIIVSCKANKWSTEALTCLKNVKTVSDGKTCDDKLTKEQRDAAEKAAEAAGAPPDKAEKADVPAGEPNAETIKAITALRDEMCACKDKACGDAVEKKWSAHEKASEGERHDEATKAAWEKIDADMMACMSALK